MPHIKPKRLQPQLNERVLILTSCRKPRDAFTKRTEPPFTCAFSPLDTRFVVPEHHEKYGEYQCRDQSCGNR
jgi:hypothetical protein